LRILRCHLQLPLHGAVPPPRRQIVVPGAATARSESETNLGMVRPTPGSLPPAEAVHPSALVRCASMTAGYPAEEPIAGKPHGGIGGGEGQQWLSYPTLVRNCALRDASDGVRGSRMIGRTRRSRTQRSKQAYLPVLANRRSMSACQSLLDFNAMGTAGPE